GAGVLWDPRPDAAGTTAAGDSGLFDGVDDAAAGILRRSGRRQVSPPGDRARAPVARPFARGIAVRRATASPGRVRALGVWGPCRGPQSERRRALATTRAPRGSCWRRR